MDKTPAQTTRGRTIIASANLRMHGADAVARQAGSVLAMDYCAGGVHRRRVVGVNRVAANLSLSEVATLIHAVAAIRVNAHPGVGSNGGVVVTGGEIGL